MKKIPTSAVVLAVVLSLLTCSSLKGWGCDFCLLSQGVSALDTIKGNGLKVTLRYTLLDEVYRGTEELPGAGAQETHGTTEITGFYSLVPHLTLPSRPTTARSTWTATCSRGPARRTFFSDSR